VVRLALHLVLAFAVGISPLVCCCAATPPSAAKEASSEPACCCCQKHQTKEEPAPAPHHPPTSCPCKQKQPRALPQVERGHDIEMSRPVANDTVVLIPLPLSFNTLSVTGDHHRVLPVHWFHTSADILRALQTLRL
jgi:hypothetical protein